MKKIVYGLVLVASLQSTQLFAWGDAGHKFVALIAYDQMTATERNSCSFDFN